MIDKDRQLLHARLRETRNQAHIQWINEGLKTVKRVQEKEGHLLSLLQSKSEKIVNDCMIRDTHTQLYSLPKQEQEIHISLCKDVLLDRIIPFLEKL